MFACGAVSIYRTKRGALRAVATTTPTSLDRSQLGESLEMSAIYHAPLDVVFSDLNVVEPDLLYISNERRKEIVTTQHVRGVPELVVEIGSPSTRTRDETIKLHLYERVGVLEYWFV